MFGRISFIVYLLLVMQGCSTEEELGIEDSFIEVKSLPFYNSPDFSPEWDLSNDGHKVPDFSFTNQDGKTISSNTIEDRIYLTNFFFTSCGSICPKMTRNMEKVQNRFMGNDSIWFISHSVNPSVDDVSKLKKYTNNFSVDSTKWHFVTGNKSEIYQMARQGYFAEKEIGFNKDSTEFLHTEHFILVDKNKRIRGVYNGTIELEMDRIIEDIQLLIKE